MKAFTYAAVAVAGASSVAAMALEPVATAAVSIAFSPAHKSYPLKSLLALLETDSFLPRLAINVNVSLSHSPWRGDREAPSRPSLVS